MNKIVIDAREYPTSTGRYVRKLLEYLEKIDGDSPERSYIVLVKSADIDAYNPKASNFTKVVSDYKEFTFGEQLGLKNQIKGLDPDLVHFTMTQQPIWYNGKVVTTMHDLTTLRFINPTKNIVVFKFKQLVYAYVVKKVATKSQKIITISNFVKKDLLQYTKVDPSKILVTLESADRITAKPVPYNLLTNRRFLLYVGRSQPHKNLSRLLEAFVKLLDDDPDLGLVIVGKKDGASDLLKQKASELGVKNFVQTGYVEEGELRWLYENCAAYVFPSLSEGFGLPSLEAMMHGAPVASSNATCLPEINGDAAHYFNPEDVDEMAEKIKEVLTDENLRKELIKNGQKQLKKYSWKRMAQQTLDIYRKALPK